MRSVRAFLWIMAVFAALSASAAEPTKSAQPRPGKYACVFPFGGQFFDSKPVVLHEGRYESASGEGAWKYDAATKHIRFQSGVLASDYPSAQYVASGLVRGGLRNKKGPAMVLRPSASYKKRQGMEAVPQYCYLQSDK